MESTPANRYAPPTAQVEDVATGVQPIRLWPPRGRIGRVRFLVFNIGIWLGTSLLAVALGAAAGFGGARPEFASLVTGVIYVVLAALVVIQRSHDMNASGWMSLLTLIPFVGLVWLFRRGTPGANRFGAPPPPNTTSLVVVAWIAGGFVALALVGIVVAVAMPAFLLPRAQN